MPRWDVDFECRLDANDPQIVRDVAKVEALAEVIHGIPLPPGVQAHLDRLNIMRAVRGTTGIEGTEVSTTEVEEIIARPTEQVLVDSRKRAEQEVRNAEKVMRFVARAVSKEPYHPVTEDLIRRVHKLTTDKIDYQHNIPGVYRNLDVAVGTYSAPRHEDVPGLMERFVDWLNHGPAQVWPAPVRAIVAHFYAISIHPFGDGNGRTARGIESFILYQGGINARGFYSLANYYYQNRAEYVAMLDHVRFETNGNITPFVRFGLTGLVAEQAAVHREVLAECTVIAFRDYARETLTEDGKMTTKPGERMFHFLLGLANDPLTLVQLRRGGHPLAMIYRGASERTIKRDLNYLERRGLIRIDDDMIRANVERMLAFTRPAPIAP